MGTETMAHHRHHHHNCDCCDKNEDVEGAFAVIECIFMICFCCVKMCEEDAREERSTQRNRASSQIVDPSTIGQPQIGILTQEGILPAREWQSATSGNIYTVEPPLVEIDQPPVVPAPSTSQSRSWGPANDTSQPSFDPHATQEKGASKIHLEPPSYNDAVHM